MDNLCKEVLGREVLVLGGALVAEAAVTPLRCSGWDPNAVRLL